MSSCGPVTHPGPAVPLGTNVALLFLVPAVGEKHPRVTRTFERLATLYDVWGKPALAAQFRAKVPANAPPAR